MYTVFATMFSISILRGLELKEINRQRKKSGENVVRVGERGRERVEREKEDRQTDRQRKRQ